MLKNVLIRIPFILELGKTILGISDQNQFKLLIKLLEKKRFGKCLQNHKV